MGFLSKITAKSWTFRQWYIFHKLKGFLVEFFCCFYLVLELTKGAINLIVNKPYGNMTLNLKLACTK